MIVVARAKSPHQRSASPYTLSTWYCSCFDKLSSRRCSQRIKYTSIGDSKCALKHEASDLLINLESSLLLSGQDMGT